MTSAALARVEHDPAPVAWPADNLTHVELTHIDKRIEHFDKRIEHWVRFGRHAAERIVDRRRRILSFRPGSVFAYIRWAANDHGTVVSRLDIVRAVSAVEPYQTLPGVCLGGDILLKIDGWPKVERVLQHIDAVEAAGIDPPDVSPDHWRHVAHRMAVNEPPRIYTPERHRAWLRRLEIEA